MDTPKEITIKLAPVHVRQALQAIDMATKTPNLDQRGNFALAALYLNIEHQLAEQENAANAVRSDTPNPNPPPAG